jgi:hypothetical protein
MATSRLRMRLCVTTLIVAGAILPPAVHAGGYQFVNIADTTMAAPGGGVFTGFSFGATAGGEVVFRATIQGGGAGDQGIFRGDGGPLSTVIPAGDVTALGPLTSVGWPTMNNGVVAFTARSATGDGVFASTGGVHTLVANVLPWVQSNSGGTVAFYAGYGPGLGGVFAGAGGALATIVKNGDPAPSGGFQDFEATSGPPSISGANVAFRGSWGSNSGLFLTSGGAPTLLLKGGDPAPLGNFGRFSAPKLSGNTVAFTATYGIDYAPMAAVMTMSGGVLTTIADSRSPAPWGEFGEYLEYAIPSIVGDTVVFSAFEQPFLDAGVFVSDGGPLTTLIKTGDGLFGGTVGQGPGGFGGGVFSSPYALDAHGAGNIGFQYELVDGRKGIAMAVYIAEPSTGAMIGVMAVLAICRRRRLS